ncbi:unnamed protein product [Rhizophagus irregularis]|uniref:Uncharacterized protein n=1 Tax=Rhizophagus irregularis TaxID=588596 RepID=A0A916E643_9GLOM|nr:unnamed protein product [Rhizophagus irregularis]
MTRKYNNSSRSERDRNRSSSDYEPSDNELARKYYKKKEKRNEDQLASLLQDDKVKGLFEEFLKNKLNEPSNTNHELEYPEGQNQTSQEDQDRTRNQSRTQEEDQDRTRSQSRTQEEDQDRTRSQSRTQEDQDLTRSQSRTQENQGRTRSQSRTQEEAQDHTRSQSRTQEDQGQGRSRGQSRTREDRGRSRTKPAVRSLRRNWFQRQAARDRSLRRIRSCTRSTSSSNLSHNDPKYIHINDLPQDLRNAIRRQIFWIVDRIPTEEQLKLDETFDSQQNLVNNTIVPTIMKTLDLDIYPISEAIVYDMIHNRHKHQREEFLKKQKETSFQDEQARRKHMNSRKNDVSNYNE